MFSYNGGSRPVSKMTRMYKTHIRYVSLSSPGGSTSWTSDDVLWSSAQGDGTGGKVCHIRLHLLWYGIKISGASFRFPPVIFYAHGIRTRN